MHASYDSTLCVLLDDLMVSLYCHIISCALSRRGVQRARPRQAEAVEAIASRVGVVTRSG